MDFSELRVELQELAPSGDRTPPSPKDLSIALAVESKKILEKFQWLTDEQSRSLPETAKRKVEAEIADVQVYLVLFAAALEIDIEAAVAERVSLYGSGFPS